MVKSCLVIGCRNRSTKRDNRAFYRVPTLRIRGVEKIRLSAVRRERWIRALGRADLTDSKLKNGHVCSDHFITGRPAELLDHTNPDWVPTRRMGEYVHTDDSNLDWVPPRRVGEYEQMDDSNPDWDPSRRIGEQVHPTNIALMGHHFLKEEECSDTDSEAVEYKGKILQEESDNELMPENRLKQPVACVQKENNTVWNREINPLVECQVILDEKDSAGMTKSHSNRLDESDRPYTSSRDSRDKCMVGCSEKVSVKRETCITDLDGKDEIIVTKVYTIADDDNHLEENSIDIKNEKDSEDECMVDCDERVSDSADISDTGVDCMTDLDKKDGIIITKNCSGENNSAHTSKNDVMSKIIIPGWDIKICSNTSISDNRAKNGNGNYQGNITKNYSRADCVDQLDGRDKVHVTKTYSRADNVSHLSAKGRANVAKNYFNADCVNHINENDCGDECMVNCKEEVRAEVASLSCSVGTQTELTTEVIEDLQRKLTERCDTAVYKAKANLQRYEMSEKYFEGNDAKTRHFTGLPNYKMLKELFDLVSPHLPSGEPPSLDKFEQFMLTLIRLRLDETVKDLSYIFECTSIAASKAFLFCVNVMYSLLKGHIIWPPREALLTDIPSAFTEMFGECVTCIIEEVSFEKRSFVRPVQTSLIADHTYKYLIGSTPQGVVGYLSESWCGGTDDDHLGRHVGLLNSLTSGDIIIANRSFRVKGSSTTCAELKYTDNVTDEPALCALEMVDSPMTARVKSCVEKVTGTVQHNYKILSGKVINYHPDSDEHRRRLDQIVTVCCALSNLSIKNVLPKSAVSDFTLN